LLNFKKLDTFKKFLKMKWSLPLLSFLLLLSFSLPAQNLKPIPQKVQQFHDRSSNFEKYDVVNLKNLPSTSSEVKNQVANAISFNINQIELNRIVQDQAQTITITFPYEDREITVELYKEDIFSDSFTVFNQHQEKQNYTPGIYYRGIEKNNPNSIAAFSFFKDEIMGVLSISGEPGNIVVGKLKDQSHHISYSDHTLTENNPFRCEADYLPPTENSQPSANSLESSDPTKCVKVYYEVAYQPFLDNNENLEQTLNWLTGVHNNVNTLYKNDDILISIHEVMVWTEPDLYTGDYYSNLDLFTDLRVNFNGDLAHLINSPSTTSVAFLDSLCTMYSYAYSGIDLYYQMVPVYSWTIMAMSHEMGHSFGSPHTHACAWNGDNTPIDVCGPTFDFTYSEGCTNGPIPYNEGGTIMSYCHLLNNVGINFSMGFGEQPANLMRNNINLKTCLGNNCTDNYELEICLPAVAYAVEPITKVVFGEIDNSVEAYSSSGYLDFTHLSTQVERGQSYEISLEGFTGGDYTSFFSVFIDFDENGSFDDDEKFFVESGNNLSVSNSSGTDGISASGFIHFPDTVSLGNKRMRIIKNYGSPIQDGCQSVQFGQIQDYNIEVVETMATDNQFFKDFVFYPNPVKNILNLKAEYPVDYLFIYDLNGRIVLDFNPKQKQIQLNLEALAQGVYFMKVNMEGKTKTYRLIKK